MRFPDNADRASVSLKKQAGVYVQGAGGGDIVINANNIELFKLTTLSAGIGKDVGTSETVGGDITLNATGKINIEDSPDIANSKSTIINDVRQGSKGQAGNINITAKGEVFVANSTILSQVEAGGVGNSGDIYVNSASLKLQNGAQLLTSIKEPSEKRPGGRGNAGNIEVKVTGLVDIAGKRGDVPSGISSRLNAGAEGNGGNITINAGSFKLRDSTFITASTIGKGSAGNVNVTASGEVFVEKSIILSQVEAGGIGKGGNISIDAASLKLENGAQLLASSLGKGSAGNVDVITRGGEVLLKNSIVSAQSITGNTGDITITSPKITLDNQSRLNSESASGDGGDIKLNSNLLLLRRNSSISTNAGTERKGGDGGNININSKFIVAIPKENSNITANAFNGRGGNVTITTKNQGIFGIEARPLESASTSDITASSENGAQGEVSIAEPDIDPNRGLIELPSNLTDASQQIAQGCTSGGVRSASKFTPTGKGGIPENPYEPLRQRAVITKWVTLPNDEKIKEEMATRLTSTTTAIVEAQSLVISRGEVKLMAQVPERHYYTLAEPTMFNCNTPTSQ
mgnify:FL=1